MTLAPRESLLFAHVLQKSKKNYDVYILNVNQLEFENAIYFDTERLLKVVSNKFGYPVPTMTLDEQFGHFTLDEPVVNEPMPELVIRQVVKATP